eukprot:746830-Hanusia_phi.AAC.5
MPGRSEAEAHWERRKGRPRCPGTGAGQRILTSSQLLALNACDCQQDFSTMSNASRKRGRGIEREK